MATKHHVKRDEIMEIPAAAPAPAWKRRPLGLEAWVSTDIMDQFYESILHVNRDSDVTNGKNQARMARGWGSWKRKTESTSSIKKTHRYILGFSEFRGSCRDGVMVHEVESWDLRGFGSVSLESLRNRPEPQKTKWVPPFN